MIDGAASSGATHAISLMTSRRSCQSALEKAGCQLTIKEKNPFLDILKRIKQRVTLKREEDVIKISNASIERDVAFYIEATSEKGVKIYNDKETFYLDRKKQRLDTAFGGFDIEFIKNGSFHKKLCFISLTKALEKTLRNFKVKTRREEPSILDLSYQDKNPLRGVCFLSEIISVYEESQKKEHENLSKKQLVYLDDRKKELESKLAKSLDHYAKNLIEAVGEKGFLSLSAQVEQLERAKEHNSSKKRGVELKLQGLSKIKNEKTFVLIEDYIGQEGVRLQQKLLSLDKESSFYKNKNIIHKPLALSKKIETFSDQINQNSFFVSLLKNPKQKILINRDERDLKILRQDLEKLSEEKIVLDHCIKNIDKALVSNTSSEMNFWDQELKTLSYWSDFERVEYQIEEANKYSEKEREIAKIKYRDFKKRIFLALKQKKEQSLEKLALLEDEFLDLANKKNKKIEEEKKVISNQIDQKLKEKKEELFLEKEFLDHQEKKILEDLKSVPSKWALDHQLNIESQMLLSIIEAVAQMVESKNIEFNLAHLKSYPIDEPYLLSKPSYLSLLTFPLIISLLFLFFAAIICTGIRIYQGFPVSLKGLKERGFTVFELEKRRFDLFASHLKQSAGSSILVIGAISEIFLEKLKSSLDAEVFFVTEQGYILNKTIFDKRCFEQINKSQKTLIVVALPCLDKMIIKHLIKNFSTVLYEYYDQPFESYLELIEADHHKLINYTLC